MTRIELVDLLSHHGLCRGDMLNLLHRTDDGLLLNEDVADGLGHGLWDSIQRQ
jgi:hypothetical protein